MNIPLILAHGQGVVAVMFAIIGTGYAASIISLACALGKKQDSISWPGITLGMIAVLYGFWLLRILGASVENIDVFWIITLLPSPIGLLAIALSFRRRKKNA